MDIERIFKSEDVARLLDRFHRPDRYEAMEVIGEAMQMGIRGYRKERNNESYAQELYDYAMQGDDEHCPVERLRFFCSNAMYHQDWLDSESYFEDILIKMSNLEEEIKTIREKDKPHFKHVGYQYKENGTWYPATHLQHTIEGNGWEIRKVYVKEE